VHRVKDDSAAHRAGKAGRRLKRRVFGVAPAQAAAVLAGVLLLVYVLLTARGFLDERDELADLTPGEEVTTGGTNAGANVDFVEWVRSQVGPDRGETFHVRPDGLWRLSRDPWTFHWLTYRLHPSLVAERPREADWLIFVRVPEARMQYDRESFEPPREWKPGFAIVRRRQ
jgi:hypothetical protein